MATVPGDGQQPVHNVLIYGHRSRRRPAARSQRTHLWSPFPETASSPFTTCSLMVTVPVDGQQPVHNILTYGHRSRRRPAARSQRTHLWSPFLDAASSPFTTYSLMVTVPGDGQQPFHSVLTYGHHSRIRPAARLQRTHLWSPFPETASSPFGASSTHCTAPRTLSTGWPFSARHTLITPSVSADNTQRVSDAIRTDKMALACS